MYTLLMLNSHVIARNCDSLESIQAVLFVHDFVATASNWHLQPFYTRIHPSGPTETVLLRENETRGVIFRHH